MLVYRILDQTSGHINYRFLLMFAFIFKIESIWPGNVIAFDIRHAKHDHNISFVYNMTFQCAPNHSSPEVYPVSYCSLTHTPDIKYVVIKYDI